MYGDDLGIGCLGLAHRLKTTMPGGDRAAWYSLSVGFNMITVCFKEHKKNGVVFSFSLRFVCFFHWDSTKQFLVVSNMYFSLCPMKK